MKTNKQPAVSGKTAWAGRAAGLGSLAVLTAALLTGCHSIMQPEDAVLGTSYKPSNVYRSSARLPLNLRRVAVLPLVTGVANPVYESGRETLDPVLMGELIKTKTCEWTAVTPEQLLKLTGRPSWSAEEALPTNIVKTVREAVGCDAILFTRMTQYRPYPPIAIGWSLKMIECKESQVIWSVDEIFDAGDGTVANAARRYYQENVHQPEPLSDSRSILASPRRFGQYTVHAVLSTLPER